jgi:hypothetical protein
MKSLTQKISTREVTAVTKPDHVALNPLESVCRRNFEKLGEMG